MGSEMCIRDSFPRAQIECANVRGRVGELLVGAGDEGGGDSQCNQGQQTYRNSNGTRSHRWQSITSSYFGPILQTSDFQRQNFQSSKSSRYTGRDGSTRPSLTAATNRSYAFVASESEAKDCSRCKDPVAE